jgi:ribosomal protein S12 methylthiotransferase accessory factor
MRVHGSTLSSPADSRSFPATGVTLSTTTLPYGSTVAALQQQMVGSLCGLVQIMGFSTRVRLAPRFAIAGAEVTGVHVLRDQPRPKFGSHHIGGMGVFLEEALIKALGETCERYSQLTAETSARHPIRRASYNDLLRAGEPVLSADKARFYTEKQYAADRFPFRPFDPDAPIGWVRMRSLLDDSFLWVPAQLVMVGYLVRDDIGEPWMISAVTTGTAAHTDYGRALANALLELIQIDSVIGHWYGGSVPTRILPDARTSALDRIVQRQFHPTTPRPAFYLLPNADLAGFSVACLIRQRPPLIPAVALGLGSDTRLVNAMYKSLLEAVGVMQLGRWEVIQSALAGEMTSADSIDPSRIFNLERNVALYSFPERAEMVERRFSAGPSVPASELAADPQFAGREQVRSLIASFRDTGKQLLYLDLSTEDVRRLGFVTLRVWSPDTLSLPLPSAPQAAHPRFEAYGGLRRVDPHPYP